MRKILFYKVSDEYGCFSNFSAHEIHIGGTKWRTVEHYFQAQKFLDDKLMYKIQISPSPMEAANIGRDRSNLLRPDWEEIKDEVMFRAVEAKFRQNLDAKNVLLSTGDAFLVEHTANDSYWGDGGDGSGKNMLGKILMEVRDLIKRDNVNDSPYMPPPWKKYPALSRYDVAWSMGAPQTYIDKWGIWLKGLTQEEKVVYMEANPEAEGWINYYRDCEFTSS